MSDIQRVGVVGCGLMGSGIAETCARAGLDVVVHEVNELALQAGSDRVARSLARAVSAGKVSDSAAQHAMGRLSATTDLTDLADRQLVIEAISEDEDAKKDLFRRLDELVTDPDAILASNTSSIPIHELAAVTNRPGSVVGMHFFNPVPVMDLCEIIVSETTDAAIAERAEIFVSDQLRKRVIHAPDRAGFIVNALLVPYLLSAIRMVEAGLATAEDIDAGMEKGCAHPMGPLKLTDFIGLDTTLSIAEVLSKGLGDAGHEPPELLRRMVSEGKLGRKAGQGFYSY